MTAHSRNISRAHNAIPRQDIVPKSTRNPASPSYLPTLDGWRAIAILAVMFCHDRVHYLGPFSTAWLYRHGNLGVDIFFAISGFLICSRLLAEEDAQGFISRRNFYIRRVFRILPPAVVFLGTLLLLKAALRLPVGVPEVFASLFFFRNYTSLFMHFQTIYPGYTGHFWTLAIEEHFYLILPTVLVLSPRKWRAPVLLLLAAAVGLHRITSNSWFSLHTDMRIDALLVPATLAVLLRSPRLTSPRNRERLIRVLRFWPLLAIGLLALVTSGLFSRITGVFIAWLTPFLILSTTLRPQSWFSQILETPPLRYLGRISYSLYLWQELFLVTHYGAIFPPLQKIQLWPFNWFITLLCALLSYYLIEQPLIRLGRRLAPNVRQS